MFKSGGFDKLLEKATSNLRLEPDWPSILQICDLIRQGDCTPKYALAAIKKKLFSANPHSAMFALLVLESCVKNCGSPIHDEIGTKVYMEQLRDLVKTTNHENVKNKVLELIQAWAYAFRNSPKYRAVQDTLNIMKTEGYKFPVLKESDAMFSADTAPEWADGDVCHRCRVQFSVMQRKHHCRACGQVFCGQCSSKTSTIPKFGFEKEVRVCEACYEVLSKPSTAAGAGAQKNSDTDLPPEYVSSVLSQQSQAPPPRKPEDELREEEELQLALALSKSEAEHKEKEKKRTTSAIMSSAAAAARVKQYSPPPATDSSPSHQDDDMDPELARYLNRSLWEKRHEENLDKVDRDRVGSPLGQQPSAPTNISSPQISASKSHQQENGETDIKMEEFVNTLKTQVEIFVNRMKSNSSRGRCIANDSSVQTLFMNITAMHSKLLRYIQQQDDSRVYYEGLQDKLTQVKDARAALDALREEHREKLRRQAEEAERMRQLQMAHKLEIMRKKKQEYLQYQRQIALQRIQEQEREMQMRQEQQKQQYMMGSLPYSMQYMPPGHPQNFLPPGSESGQFGPGAMMPPGGHGSYGSLPVTSGVPTSYRDYPQYSMAGHHQPGQTPSGPISLPPPGMPAGPPQQGGPVSLPPGSISSMPRPQHGPMPGPMMGMGPQGPVPGPMMGPMGPMGPRGPMPQGPMPNHTQQMPGQGPQNSMQGPMQNHEQQVPPMQGPGQQGPPMQGPLQQGPPMQGPPHQGPPMQGPPQQVPSMQGPLPQQGPGPQFPQGPGITESQTVPPGSPQQPTPNHQQQQPPSQQQPNEQQETAELISFD